MCMFQTQVEKGNDLLEEANVLSQSGSFTGLDEVSHDLHSRMSSFTSQLDEMREKIENTNKCYHLLDKVM